MESYTSLLLDSLRLRFTYVDRYDFTKYWVFPKSILPYSMFRYIVEGSAKFNINNKEILVHKGQIIYLPEKSALECQALSNIFSFISIRFNGEIPFIVNKFWSDILNIPLITQCDNEDVISYFHDIVKFFKGKSPSKIIRAKGYLNLILAYVLEKCLGGKNMDVLVAKSSEDNYPTQKVNPLVQLIIENIIINPKQNITVKSMCDMVDMSESSLRRIFKKYTTYSPVNFIRYFKIKIAQQWLIEANERISAISCSLGFKDPNYFTRIFKKYCGVTPKEYRKTSRG